MCDFGIGKCKKWGENVKKNTWIFLCKNIPTSYSVVRIDSWFLQEFIVVAHFFRNVSSGPWSVNNVVEPRFAQSLKGVTLLGRCLCFRVRAQQIFPFKDRSSHLAHLSTFSSIPLPSSFYGILLYFTKIITRPQCEYQHQEYPTVSNPPNGNHVSTINAAVSFATAFCWGGVEGHDDGEKTEWTTDEDTTMETCYCGGMELMNTWLMMIDAAEIRPLLLLSIVLLCCIFCVGWSDMKWRVRDPITAWVSCVCVCVWRYKDGLSFLLVLF